MPNKEAYQKLIQFYRKMLLYRRYEERVLVAYTKQKFSGFCHVHIGQEAVCVGVQEALEDKDYVLGSYRSHTQAIAKGITPEAVFAELLERLQVAVKVRVVPCICLVRSTDSWGVMVLWVPKHPLLWELVLL